MENEKSPLPESIIQVTFWQAFYFGSSSALLALGTSWTNCCDASGTR